MKKYFIIILFLGVFLSGCQVDSTPIYYRSFQDQRFLKIDENSYRYENQYIYVTDPDKDLQIITTSFSNVIIEVKHPSKQRLSIQMDVMLFVQTLVVQFLMFLVIIILILIV